MNRFTSNRNNFFEQIQNKEHKHFCYVLTARIFGENLGDIDKDLRLILDLVSNRNFNMEQSCIQEDFTPSNLNARNIDN